MPHAPPTAPTVTVAIPTMNRPQLCALAVRSALAQQGVACRVLISENRSDLLHAEAYQSLFASLPGQVRVIRQSKRLSIEDHFRFLLAQVDTDYVNLLADDDAMTPSFLVRALDAAGRSGAGVVFGPYRLDYSSSGERVLRNHDYTDRSRLCRAARFLCSRDDAFIYGLFRTDLLQQGMAEFQPLRVLGRRTLLRIAYAPLFACLLAAPYAHLPGEVVWINTPDSAKNEAYLGEHKGRKWVELVLGEWLLAARFLRLAWQAGGAGLASCLAPVIALAGVKYCLSFTWLALQRLAGAPRR
jgi:hypothetical protein